MKFQITLTDELVAFLDSRTRNGESRAAIIERFIRDHTETRVAIKNGLVLPDRPTRGNFSRSNKTHVINDDTSP